MLAWLLGEEAGHRVREVLGGAELVMASDLLLVECDRVLTRAVTLGEVDEATAGDRRAHLNAAATPLAPMASQSGNCGSGQGARFLRNPFAHLMPFTWRRRWPHVPLSRAQNF